MEHNNKMKLKQYINELSMTKGTKISSPEYRKESIYNQRITLHDNIIFQFQGYYFKTSDIWEIDFVDENNKADISPKRKGASLELFAALEKVLDEFMNKALPNKLEFRATIDEKSRVKLYDRLAKKLASKYGFKYNRKVTSISVLYQFIHKSVQGNWLDI